MRVVYVGLALQMLGAPALISTIDTGKLKGEPTELAWSADGAQLFLQTSERDAKGMVSRPRFFVMAAADGKPAEVDAPPAWAAEYWTWKSKQFAPGSTSFGIDIKQEDRSKSATASPMGGTWRAAGRREIQAAAPVPAKWRRAPRRRKPNALPADASRRNRGGIRQSAVPARLHIRLVAAQSARSLYAHVRAPGDHGR